MKYTISIVCLVILFVPAMSHAQVVSSNTSFTSSSTSSSFTWVPMPIRRQAQNPYVQEALGMTENSIAQALIKGDTVESLAIKQGYASTEDFQKLVSVLHDEALYNKIQRMVEAGTITQAQADRMFAKALELEYKRNLNFAQIVGQPIERIKYKFDSGKTGDMILAEYDTSRTIEKPHLDTFYQNSGKISVPPLVDMFKRMFTIVK